MGRGERSSNKIANRFWLQMQRSTKSRPRQFKLFCVNDGNSICANSNTNKKQKLCSTRCRRPRVRYFDDSIRCTFEWEHQSVKN